MRLPARWVGCLQAVLVHDADCRDALVEARAVIYHARKYDGLVVGLYPVDAGTLRKSTSRHRATGKAAPRVSCQCATALSVYIAYPKRSM